MVAAADAADCSNVDEDDAAANGGRLFDRRAANIVDLLEDDKVFFAFLSFFSFLCFIVPTLTRRCVPLLCASCEPVLN